MGNKDISPRVHLFEEIFTIEDNHIIMVVLPDGDKVQTKAITLRKYLEDSLAKMVTDRLNNISQQIDNMKVTKDNIIEAFSDERAINLGRPLNIASNSGIEKTGKDGDIYVGKNEVRVKIAGKWCTIKVEQ